MKKYLTVIGTFICSIVVAQRDTIPLNTDWQFTLDKNNVGFNQGWFDGNLPDAHEVTIPHTWNVIQGSEMYYGQAWYQKKVTIPRVWKNKNVVLQFGAVNHTSTIYINGKKVREHIGDGFNKFFINLNGKVKYGKENVITVAVNNEYGTNKVPYGTSFDWPNDGGIIRPVSLIVTGKPSADYINVLAKLNVPDSSGNLKIKLDYDRPVPKEIQFLVTITEENQSTQNVVYSKILKPVLDNDKAITDISLPHVHPWNFDYPNLYRVSVTVIYGKKEVDKISSTAGFREIKFMDGKTYLNGEQVKLMGVEWTAGSNPNFGFAEPDSEIIRMGKLMKSVNCIFSRVHFQQGDTFYDFCDRNGILVQEEVPLWGGETPANDTIERIAMRQLHEMIRNHYNHPSIITWGVGNELRGRDPKMKAMIEKLLDEAKALDPSRFNSYVSNTLAQGFYSNPGFTPDAGSLGDFIMMNEYGGSWWSIPVAEIGNYIDSVHLSYPHKPFFISEFGICEPNFRGGDERRLQDLIYHMSIYESKPYVQGAIYFDLTDYRTHYPGTTENDKYRRRIHGIFDMYGNPKPSMKVLRELSSPVEVQQLRQWKKDKANVLILGSMGLPQHVCRGYKLYLSDKTGDYKNTKVYQLPEIKPGEKINFEIDDLYNGEGIITVVSPLGYVVSQKSFYKTLD